MPRVTTWKVPLALFVLAFVLKVAFSLMISDAAGRWVGGVFGFLAVVTVALYAAPTSRSPEDERPAPPG